MAKKRLREWFGLARKPGPSVTPDSDADPGAIAGPSPNPMTNLILADIALRGGGMLLRRGIERGLLGKRYAPDKADKIMKGRSMAESVVGAAIARVATKSVPGAILVGGGMLAKTLFDRRKGKVAQIEGEAAMDAKAADGEAQEP